MNNPLAVLRVGKIKNNEIYKVAFHNFRKHAADNIQQNISASRTKFNQTMFGSKDLKKSVAEKLEKTTNRRGLRKDANVLLEFMFSVSPTYFYDGLDREFFNLLTVNKDKAELDRIYKTINQDKLEKWKQAVFEYCQKEFGDNLVNIELHLDEKTPHIHVLLTPILKDGRLTAKEFFTPEAVLSWQNGYANAVKHLGIDRGEENSQSIHRDQKQHNKELDTIIPEPKIPKIPPLPKFTEEELSFLNSKKKLLNYQEVVKTREKGFKTAIGFYKPFFKENKSKIVAVKELERQNNLLKEKNKSLQIANKRLKDQNQEFLEKLRKIEIESVLENLAIGYKKDGTNHLKIPDLGITIDKKRNYYANNRANKKGFGSIGFLIDCLGYSFVEAVNLLKTTFGNDAASREVISRKEGLEIVKSKLEATFQELPKQVENQKSAIEYLTKERGLSLELINPLLKSGRIYQDPRNNVIFTNIKKTFAAIRGTLAAKKFIGVRGKPDFITYDFGNSGDIYCFESAIDALSFRQLNPKRDGTYIVTNGNMMINQVPDLIRNCKSVYLCFDNDQAGQLFCNEIKSKINRPVQILKPNNKDWNEDLILANRLIVSVEDIKSSSENSNEPINPPRPKPKF